MILINNKIMKKLCLTSVMSAVFAIFVLTTSCVTEKKCHTRYPCPQDTNTKVVYKDSIRIDSIFIIMPADTVQIKTKVPCDDFKTETRANGKKLTIESKNGILLASCTSDVDSLLSIIKAKDTYISEIENKTKIVKEIEYQISGWQWLKIIGAVVLAFLIGVFIGFVKK